MTVLTGSECARTGELAPTQKKGFREGAFDSVVFSSGTPVLRPAPAKSARRPRVTEDTNGAEPADGGVDPTEMVNSCGAGGSP